ncbi:hypothetical protein ETD86_12945 [Nonomuraea turkmeniaca]|uniref:Uncharacterized protein n=1 Tax=Nonomuraea turkmeniaca TaxID=103838 RepID=A0A5S4FN63_9ACTN|nr:hypothetical protein [Nonomuraea turkmeniaca]TMR22069.1 hypothetical protein ETD86_12945 [Nonomuraea turkmeniaca]
MDLKPGHTLTFVISSEARYASVVPVHDIIISSDSNHGSDWQFSVQERSDRSNPANVHGDVEVSRRRL